MRMPLQETYLVSQSSWLPGEGETSGLCFVSMTTTMTIRHDDFHQCKAQKVIDKKKKDRQEYEERLTRKNKEQQNSEKDKREKRKEKR